MALLNKLQSVEEMKVREGGREGGREKERREEGRGGREGKKKLYKLLLDSKRHWICYQRTKIHWTSITKAFSPEVKSGKRRFFPHLHAHQYLQMPAITCCCYGFLQMQVLATENETLSKVH